MTEEKISAKRIVISALLFLIGFVALIEIIFLMLIVNNGLNVFDYVKSQFNSLVLLAISLSILTVITYLYFYFENKQILNKVSKIFEIFLILYVALILSYLIGKFINPNARPLAFLAMMAVTLIGRRDAIFFNVIFALMQFLIDRFSGISVITEVESFACLLVTFCSGTLSIFIFQYVKTRLQCVLLTFLILLPTEIIIALMELIYSTNNVTLQSTFTLLMYGGLDAVFSTLLYLFVLPVVEMVFSELTVFRLRELTSDDAKLIKRLKNNAPGTYNHSVVVAQLVEVCARAIGEDSELARAAAYYHDMGKLKNPEMFTENQTDYNFHNEITPELSVDIIRSHAKDGATLIKKNHLPEFFADIAIQHHGTMPIKYFYAKALKMSDGELNIENYSYSGPTPTSKIAAIIMIVDASEAAARSLIDHSPEAVEALVRSLIEERVDLDQFENCNITMRELTIIKHTIVSQLTGVYHSRVSYPKIKISKKK
ncbi:MAG: HDIG domain-containing protein [Clostridia bacterium]|nr:HDIG domain-containing protein [Clostridia bacterium]